jgi:general secretion pathway protein K
LWSVKSTPDKRKIPRFSTAVDYHFATGDVHVELLPEAGKLDVNAATPEVLYRVNMALGMEPERARQIALAIDDWRRPGAEAVAPDAHYMALGPTFRVLHTSIREIEELLQVKGVTPDLFYGTYIPAPEGADPRTPRLVPRPGLIDCFSVFGSKDRLDVNTAQPAVLLAIGLPPEAVNAIVQQRNQTPFTEKSLGEFLQMINHPGALLRVEGNSIVTMRSTARLRLANGQLSDLRRTVAAQVKYMPPGYDSPIHILRWYDSTWTH